MKLNLSLGALAALQLVASLLVQLAVLRIVGAGPQTDAFVAAQALPLVLFSILSVSLQSVWQPRFAMLAENKAKWRDAQGVAQGQSLITFGGVAALLWLSTDYWIPALFPGFNQTQSQLTSSMTLPLFAGAALNCHSALFTTALRASDRFIRAEIVSLLGTLLSLFMIVVTVPFCGVQGAAWVALARAVAVCGVLHWQADRPTPHIRRAWTNREMWRQLKPLLAGSSLYKTAPLVDRYWSSQASVGGVTVLNLAQTAVGALATVFERAVCVPVAPQLARLVGREDFAGVRKAYRRCVRRISLATGLIGVGLAALYPVWEALLESLLKIPSSLAAEMWLVCLLLLGYLHVAASGTIAVAAFYAMGDTRTPVKVGVTGFIAGVLLKSAGFLLIGLPGLAIATSIYYVCNMVALCALLEKKIDARIS